MIEVAGSSLTYDRTVKRALYASYGIIEFWIVNLDARLVETCREPSGEDYLSTDRVAVGPLGPAALPGAAIEIAATFV